MRWQAHALGQYVEVLSGFAFKSEKFNTDRIGTPLVRIRDVVPGTTSTYYDGPYQDQFLVENGDILVGMDGEFNCAKWMGGPALLNQRVCRIKPNNGALNEDYLFRFLPDALKEIERRTPFVTVKHLSAKDISQIKIPLPPVDEQRRIAAILDQADDLRRKRRKALGRVRQLSQSVFLDLFGDPITNHREWPVLRLGDAGTLDRGISKHRPRNDPALLGGPYPLIQTGDIANCDDYVRGFTATYSELGLKQSRLWPAGTLCITIAANIGKTGILTFNACFPDSVVGFTPGDRVRTEFVQQWFDFIQPTLEKDAPQFAQKNINLSILRDLPLAIPPYDLQRTFAARVAQVDELKTHHRAHLAKLDALFASLQNRAFRGEL